MGNSGSPIGYCVALPWVIRGLAATGHVDWDTEQGWILPNSWYYSDPAQFTPFVKLERKAKKLAEQEIESDEDVNLSEYEQARRERVARNQEKLRLLGLG